MTKKFACNIKSFMQAQESMFCLEIHKKLLSESEFDQGTMSATSTQESFCDITFE